MTCLAPAVPLPVAFQRPWVAYDLARTLALVPRGVLWHRLGRSLPLSRPAPDANAWICSDSVLVNLSARIDGFSEGISPLPLAWHALHAGVVDDLWVIAERRPDLLSPVC